jgi:hypothetical protein
MERFGEGGPGFGTPPTFPRKRPSISRKSVGDFIFDNIRPPGIVNVDPRTPGFGGGFGSGFLAGGSDGSDGCIGAILDAVPASMREASRGAVLDLYFNADKFLNNQLAYVFATVEHESQFTPIYEKGPRKYFDKYEPTTKLGREVLGNTQPGDGYTYRVMSN